MSEPQVWFDLVRRAVKSEEEGLAIIRNDEAMKFMRRTSDAIVGRPREDGKRLVGVNAGEPQLVVNLKREGVFAEYTHFVEVLTTAVLLPNTTMEAFK